MKILPRGFAALAAVIAIAAALLSTTLTLGLGSLNARLNAHDAVSRARGRALASACVRRAMLDIALGQDETGPIIVDASTEPQATCLIRGVTTNADGDYVIRAAAEWPQRGQHRTETELSVTVRSSDLGIIAWQELPSCHARDSPGRCW